MSCQFQACWTSNHIVSPAIFLSKALLLMAEIRYPPVEVDRFSHYLEGFIHPKGGAGFEPSTVVLQNIQKFEIPKHKPWATSQWLTLKGTRWSVICHNFRMFQHIFGTHIHTYIHTYIRTYIPTYIHTYIHTFIHSYIHTFLRSYVLTFLRSYVLTFLHSYIHSYIHTFIHSCIHIFIHSCIHPFMHSYFLTFIHSYIHSFTCIHAYRHTCIHAYIYTHTLYQQVKLLCYQQIIFEMILTKWCYTYQHTAAP